MIEYTESGGNKAIEEMIDRMTTVEMLKVLRAEFPDWTICCSMASMHKPVFVCLLPNPLFDASMWHLDYIAEIAAPGVYQDHVNLLRRMEADLARELLHHLQKKGDAETAKSEGD